MMTAFNRSLALLGLLCFAGCADTPVTEAGPSSTRAAASETSALAPRADAPVLAAVSESAELAAEEDMEPIYANRPDAGAREVEPLLSGSLDPRDPALVPDGTPDDNATAFFAMRKSKHDAIPVGGIGPHGIHIDSLVVGRGFSNSRCESESHEFSVDEDDRVNLCLRVVHGGHDEESLTVEWTRDGHGPKATRLSLHNSHAYRTRAWLPIRHYSKGDWHVVVTASDGSVLGEADFTVR